jgi:NADH:ubiquinone oxidoreductase subunit 4 (subunit M)
MDNVLYLIAGLFLPLFPMSMVFNVLLRHTQPVVLRVLVIILWPQLGLILLSNLGGHTSAWILPLAIATSGLYALRALALRDMRQWSGFLATSAWALLWISYQTGTPITNLHLYALGYSAPLALLTLLIYHLEQRFGGAYTGLHGGLAQSLPRLSVLFVLIILAIIATPIFPGFFIMLSSIVNAFASTPAIGVVLILVWLLWSWAGARLLQGVIAGPTTDAEIIDLNRMITWCYGLGLLLLIVAGIYGIGELL